MMPRTTTTAASAPARISWDDTPIPDDPRAYGALTGAMAVFQANGEQGEQMIARLHRLLDRMETLPVDDVAGWVAGVSRYLGLRRGPLPRPLPPGAWPWKHTLAHGVTLAWDLASEAHHRYRQLGKTQRLRAASEFGRFADERGNPAPLLRRGWPVEALAELDRRSGQLCVDVRARQALAPRERHQVKGRER